MLYDRKRALKPRLLIRFAQSEPSRLRRTVLTLYAGKRASAAGYWLAWPGGFHRLALLRLRHLGLVGSRFLHPQNRYCREIQRDERGAWDRLAMAAEQRICPIGKADDDLLISIVCQLMRKISGGDAVRFVTSSLATRAGNLHGEAKKSALFPSSADSLKKRDRVSRS